MINQKTLAKFLDAAAARADMIDRAPATRKQCWFLAGLIAKADDQAIASEVMKTSFVLTKKRASFYIDNLLAA